MDADDNPVVEAKENTEEAFQPDQADENPESVEGKNVTEAGANTSRPHSPEEEKDAGEKSEPQEAQDEPRQGTAGEDADEKEIADPAEASDENDGQEAAEDKVEETEGGQEVNPESAENPEGDGDDTVEKVGSAAEGSSNDVSGPAEAEKDGARDEASKQQEEAQGDEEQMMEDEKEIEKEDENEEEKRDEEEADEHAEAEERNKEEEENKIPADFYYNFEEFVSKAEVTEGSGLPADLLALQHSFGYDCRRRHNLHLLDENNLLFIAGNVLQILNIRTKKQTYIRSTSGGSIGALAVHPSRRFFAVGEKGKAPNINVFEYPSLKLYRILRGGTEASYASLNYSPDGELLASQGGDPDYMLTVWNWREEKIMLRSKAFSQDVFRVTFASELEGQLTTVGTSHIRFWKMADTFTGLKLQGELGRFGRTQISDIEGYVELPDGKVLSGCDWGNLLLWDGGLIKVEVTKRGRKPCHTGPIMQILLDEGELITVGVDGFIRVWDFETIDTADQTDESGLFEMDPMNELRVGQDVHLYSIVKSIDEENEPTIWHAQDANGGIWRLDLSFSHTSQAPEKLMTYHSGSIMGCVTSPNTHLAASVGIDNSLRVFDYGQQKQLSESHFNAGGTSILWAPQIVDPKSSTVVAGFEDGVVRILTVNQLPEDIRRNKKGECEVALKQVFKPHSKAVTAMAYDGKGQILATGSQDATVFFINVGDPYEPIGFIQVPAPVRQLIWTPEKYNKQALLVICDEGIIVELGMPDEDKLDTSHTFQIKDVPVRQYTFRSIKSRLRHEEELERKKVEEEERKKKEEEERRRRIERGLETESEHGDEHEDQPKHAHDDWQPFIPKEQSPILHAFYDANEEGYFWLSMGEFDSGYLYKCKFFSAEEKAKMRPEAIDEPILALPIVDSHDVPISTLIFSASGTQALLGMQDGSIRVQTLQNPFSFVDSGPYWSLPMHDAQTGRIRSLALAYDQTQLLSAGDDGNFFLYSYMADEELQRRITEYKAKLPSARKKEELEKVVDDIDDPTAYSIEEAKQKAEHDKMMKEAEEKKRDVRRQIAKLRRQFKSILEQNDMLPKTQQLPRLEFEMDREIKVELERQTSDRVDLVRKELAWDSEKQRLSLEKLRKRFKDVVECERIAVKAFMSPHEVTSFRTTKLSDDFYQLKAEYERKKTQGMTKDDFTRDPTHDLLAGQRRAAEGTGQGGDAVDEAGAASKVQTTLKGSMGERINKALQKVEEKKKKRAARKALWEELYASKPDDEFEDPADVVAIREAKENMGDYKLKTALDYVVPDHLRMNVEKARGRLLVLKDQIHDHKYEFNVRLLALRDKKIRIIEEIRDHVKHLVQIQSRLDRHKHKPVPYIPELHFEEMPEKRLEYTRETLIQFKQEMAEREAATKKGGGDGGFGGGFGGGFSDKQTAQGLTQPGKQASLAGSSLQPQDAVASRDPNDPGGEELSPLEQELHLVEQIKLEYEQSDLIGQITSLVQRFDAELRMLRHEKFKMDIVMTSADLRQVTLFEELVLLKEYEKSEDVLAEKVTSKQQEKLEMQNKILEVQGKLEAKRKDIEKLQEKEKAVHQAFLQSLGDNNKFADYLTKVFRKKIKRTKKKTTEGEGSDEESDEDSDDDSDWEESDGESESETGGYDLDICPPGCDQALYDSTTTMREKRLDAEEALAEEKKNNEAFKKELDALQKKARVIDSSLKTAQNELEAFQLEKQQKLNELDIVATLCMHQVQYIINSVLPSDLSQTLVFESTGVVRLQQRIKELEHEKFLQKKQMREARKKHVQLIKDRRHFDANISEMESKCNAMMVAKFGCPVDLEKLEGVTVNRTIEELKEKLHQVEAQCDAELQKMDNEISTKREVFGNLIRDNTHRLEQMGVLVVQHKLYQEALDKRQKDTGDEYVSVRPDDVRERQRLIQLVQLQAQEIDALKDEILLLSRKGGHILPPAQPPMSHIA